MRIGVGCTTYNRPECLSKWKEQIAKHTSMDNVLIYIADDSVERKGVAYRKNECLRALKDCDYVFLYDDDCFPVKDGWIDFFVNSGEKHLLFMNESHTCYDMKGSVCYFKDCGGVFMFFTKDIIEKFGYMNEAFGLYGFEHAEYSSRILGGHGKYPMLKGTEKYIYAEDYSNPEHKSSISIEEKNECIKNNWNKFLKFANK